MSGSPEGPWSNNPNAPQIPYVLYVAEKSLLAGLILGAVFYGVVIVLFIQCIVALLNPADYSRRGIKWGLVAIVMAIFSCVTICTAINLDFLSKTFIDDRDFSAANAAAPGPLGYQFYVNSFAINVFSNFLFYLNNWLADGLLLFRCYVIYSMNPWVTVLPCLMYLASIALGITITYYESLNLDPDAWNTIFSKFGVTYYAISFSLTALLTLLIITRLILHKRLMRKVMGPQATSITIYKTIATMLVESYALYAINFALFLGPLGAKSLIGSIFLPLLPDTQAIAPFLITLRIAKQTAMTTNGPVSAVPDSIRFRSDEGTAGVDDTLTNGYPLTSFDSKGEESPVESGTEVGLSVEEARVLTGSEANGSWKV